MEHFLKELGINEIDIGSYKRIHLKIKDKVVTRPNYDIFFSLKMPPKMLDYKTSQSSH